jgi:hypothetical protein
MCGEPHILKKCNEEDYFCHFVHYSSATDEGHIHKDLDNYYYKYRSESSVSVVYNLFGEADFFIWGKRLPHTKMCGTLLQQAVDNDQGFDYMRSIFGEPKIIRIKESEMLVFRSKYYHMVKARTDGRFIFQFNAGYSMNNLKSKGSGGGKIIPDEKQEM